MSWSWGKAGPQGGSSKTPVTPSRQTAKPGPGAKQTEESATVARPLRLLYCDDNGRFVVEPEAIRALQAVKGPVGVVAVCGRARQGKSFILNQLLGRSSGFAVAATHRPCTKGLWLWSQPVARVAADGSAYHLVLLDSEGIDAYDQTGTYSVQIFSLAVLLSSMFVYNQMGGIDEAAIDRLSLVTEMTHHIRVKAAGTDNGPVDLGPFSPAFLWLLRDFYLDLSEDGRRITPRDYLEAALQPTPGSSKAVHAKNQIRESIRALFPRRDCFTLVRPVHDEQQLQRLDSLDSTVLRPEFKAGLEALTGLIFERTRPKQMEGATLTGPMLAALAQSFVGAINQGAVPTIATAWQSVAEGECRRAYEAALAVYSASFDRSTPPEEALLLAAHSAAVETAVGTFSKEAAGSVELRQPFEAKLRAELGKQFQDYRGRVLVEAELACTRALATLDARLAAAADVPGARLKAVVGALETSLAEYERTAAGPGKAAALVAYLRKSLASGPLRRVVESERAAAASASSQLQAQLDRVTAARDAAEKEAAASEKRADALRRERDSDASARRAAETRSDAALARAQAEAREREERQAGAHQQSLAAKESEVQQLSSRFREKEAAAASLAAQVRHLEDTVRWLEDTASASQRSHDASLSAIQQRADQLAAEKAAEIRAREVAESALKGTQADAARVEAEKARLMREKDDTQALLAAAEAGALSSDRKLTEMKADMEKLAEKGQVAQRSAAKVKQLEQQLQDARGATERESATVAQLRAEADRRKTELAASEERLRALNTQLDIAQQDRRAAEEQVTTLTQKQRVMDERIARHATEAAAARTGARGDDDQGGAAMEVEAVTQEQTRKRARTEAGPAHGAAPDGAAMVVNGGDPARKTMAQLKQELTTAGYANEILAVKGINKKQLLQLYQDKGLAG